MKIGFWLTYLLYLCPQDGSHQRDGRPADCRWRPLL